MRTVKDLRDLVNVSRLTFRESDDENDFVTNESNNFNYNQSIGLDNSKNNTINLAKSLTKSNSNGYLNERNLKEVKLNSSSLGKQLKNHAEVNPIIDLDPVNSITAKSNRTPVPMSPIISKANPIESNQIKKKHPSNINELNSYLINNNLSSMSFDRSTILDRNSAPRFSFANLKKPLPPLQSNSNQRLSVNTSKADLDYQEMEEHQNENSTKYIDKNKNSNLTSKIVPVADDNLNAQYNDVDPDENLSKNMIKNGNFDEILVYIDASVVSDWLNRANRSLKKMFKWHQENTYFKAEQSLNSSKMLKYESFILFCSFWLGFNENAKFNDKQRRSLIEMEYSIICDEVMQAFQVGIDDQKITVNQINQLIKAVFKEYPIQFLSFRGAYLLLDYVDILSSDRHEDYKKLLSDVKCRTINKQYAQWLLSIRSFALINLCWSIIKFFRKTVEPINADRAQTASRTARQTDQNQNKEDGKSLLAELDGRLSSMSFSNFDRKNSNEKESSLSSSSASSISSSTSSISSSSKSKSRSAKAKKKVEDPNLIISNSVKHDLYLEAVFKHDLPDVLHYLITTKKCDPYKLDEHGRNLIFLAVMNDKPKILSYLIKRWPSIDVNAECDSGNTPLHAAVNKGKLNLVEIILKSLENDTNDKKTSRGSYKLEINKINPKCMDATALHLAVWNEYTEIALRLLQAKADPNLKMNKLSTAFDLAKESSNEILYDLLIEYSQYKK